MTETVPVSDPSTTDPIAIDETAQTPADPAATDDTAVVVEDPAVDEPGPHRRCRHRLDDRRRHDHAGHAARHGPAASAALDADAHADAHPGTGTRPLPR